LHVRIAAAATYALGRLISKTKPSFGFDLACPQANRRLEEQQHALRQHQADAKVHHESLDKTQTELDVTKTQLEDVCKQLADTQLRVRQGESEERVLPFKAAAS
jgi:septal ring factor EnvC (AmiA/AmiB activator)